LDQDDIDEIPKEEPVLDKDDSINEHNNDGSIGIPAFSQTFNLNPLAEEYIYLGKRSDLIGNNVQDIYNTGKSEK
jgi:hypothetical protein